MNSKLSSVHKLSKRLMLLLGAVLLFYLACAVVGLIPVNNSFTPAGEDGVEIFVFSGTVHTDLILPVEIDGFDWRARFPASDFQGMTRHAKYVGIGWGDRGFYLETKTWADMKVSVAANAMFWPSPAVMHVSYYGKPKENESCRAVTISGVQYRKLIEQIERSFEQNGGAFHRIEGDKGFYGSNDAFYAARGRYHCFNTCNCWASDALQQVGVRTGFFTPFPRTVLWYLP